MKWELLEGCQNRGHMALQKDPFGYYTQKGLGTRINVGRWARQLGQ